MCQIFHVDKPKNIMSIIVPCSVNFYKEKRHKISMTIYFYWNDIMIMKLHFLFLNKE